MMNEPKKPSALTRTGIVPRIDYEGKAIKESPQPFTHIEPSDPGSMTGLIHIVSEGVDTAKQADDSATLSDSQADVGSKGW